MPSVKTKTANEMDAGRPGRVPRKLEERCRKLHIRAELLKLISQGSTSIRDLCAAFDIVGAHVNLDRFLKFGYTWVISEQRAQALLAYARQQPAGAALTPPPSMEDEKVRMRSRLRLLIKMKRISIYDMCAALGINFSRACDFLINARPPKLSSLEAEEVRMLLSFTEEYEVRDKSPYRTSEMRLWIEGIKSDFTAAVMLNDSALYSCLCDICTASVEKAFKLCLAAVGGSLGDYFTVSDLRALNSLCRGIEATYDPARAVEKALARLEADRQEIAAAGDGSPVSKKAASDVMSVCADIIDFLLAYVPGDAGLSAAELLRCQPDD